MVTRSERSRAFGERLCRELELELRRADYVKRLYAIDDILRDLALLERDTLRTMPAHLRWYTPQHKRLKATVHRRDRYRCVRCGAERQLRLHHRRYDRVGTAREAHDCETLCSRCHAGVHLPRKRGVHAAQMRLM